MGAITEHLVLRALVVTSGQAGRTTTAADARLEHDTRAGYHVRCRRRDNLPGHIAARNMRQRNRNPRQPATLPEIQMIQRAGAHAHQHFAGRGHRIGDLLVAQNLGAAVGVETNRVHLVIG